MIFTAENILMVGSVLIFSGILISKTGYRFGIPTLLLFLLVGMGFGSDGLGLQFNSASDAQFIGMMALSIILFSGGMDTKYSDIKPVLTPGIVLSTAGVLLTTLLTGVFIFYISNWNQTNINLTLMCSLLLAATMSSTDSASVFNLLRSQRMNLKQNLRPMLELESGSNDPVAYMLTIVLIQVISSGSSPDFLLIIKDLLVQFFFGGVIGYAMGRFSVWLINRINLSNSSLYPILLLSLLFITFYVASSVATNCFNYNDIGGKSWVNTIIVAFFTCLPAIVLPAIQYGTYFSQKHMMWAQGAGSAGNPPMYVLWLFPIILILFFSTVINRVVYKATKNPYITGVTNAIIVSIITITNTCTTVI